MSPSPEEPPFVPGLELGEALYREVLRPLLDAEHPGLSHSAALIGTGSDVLGFDTVRSRDHHWGPRAQIFLSSPDLDTHGEALRALFRARLPVSFHGHSLHFSPETPGESRVPLAGTPGEVDSLVEVTCLGDFFRRAFGVSDVLALDALDWLAIPEQSLRELTAGRVFHDGLRALAPARESLREYPRDVWLYRMASQWHRIGEEEPFVGRARELGDALGGRLLVARVARELMRLAFLIERVYAPYMKWFGTAFTRLECAQSLGDPIARALAASDLGAAEDALAEALEECARMHNALGLGDPLETNPRHFFNRPYQVIGAWRFELALHALIEDERLRQLPTHTGAVDQLCDATGVMASPKLTRFLRRLYGR